MNVADKQDGTIAEQAAEIQRLRDEINRLKGEQGKPRVLANKPTRDLSSEKERRQSKPRNMRSKQAYERRQDDENERDELLESDQLLGDDYGHRARASGRWGDGPDTWENSACGW